MPKLSGISAQRAIRALEKAGFRVARQRKHISMTDGVRVVTIPQHKVINGYTMADIISKAGLTIEEFKNLL